jgi:hypothetical protein
MAQKIKYHCNICHGTAYSMAFLTAGTYKRSLIEINRGVCCKCTLGFVQAKANAAIYSRLSKGF